MLCVWLWKIVYVQAKGRIVLHAGWWPSHNSDTCFRPKGQELFCIKSVAGWAVTSCCTGAWVVRLTGAWTCCTWHNLRFAGHHSRRNLSGRLAGFKATPTSLADGRVAWSVLFMLLNWYLRFPCLFVFHESLGESDWLGTAPWAQVPWAGRLWIGKTGDETCSALDGETKTL